MRHARILLLILSTSGGLLGCGKTAEPLPDGDPSLALEYSFGNQIYGSVLQIKRDGSIVHNERSCCPPAITPRTESALAASELVELLGRIEEASQGSVEMSSYTTADGALYGALDVHTAGVKKALVRQYAFGEERRNLSSAAAELVALANRYAQTDMPE